MYTATRRSWSLACKLPAKRIAGRRFALPRSTRSFHSSPSKRIYNPFGVPSTSQPPENPTEQQSSNADATAAENTKIVPGVIEGGDVKEAPGDPNGDGNGRNGYYGSASRRRSRNSRPREIPPIRLPQWFVDNNISLADEVKPRAGNRREPPPTLSLDPSQEITAHRTRTNDIRETVDSLGKDTKEVLHPLANRLSELQTSVEEALTRPSNYTLSKHIYSEIYTCISASLNLSHVDPSSSFPASKSHLKLHFPLDGGNQLVETIVYDVAEQLGADVVRLEAQDLAEICSEYIKEGREATSNSFWTLGYDAAQRFYPPPKPIEAEELQEEAEEDEDEDAMDPRDARKPHRMNQMTAVPLMSFATGGSVQDIINKLNETASGVVSKAMGSRGNNRGNGSGFASIQMPDSNPRWDELKLTALLEVLADANTFKRMRRQSREPGDVLEAPAKTSAVTEESLPAEASEENGSPNELVADIEGNYPEKLQKTIVLIRGMKELSATPKGSVMLEKIFDAVERKRKLMGQDIMLVGTTASSELTPELSKLGIEALQTENPDSVYRTIVVTPGDAGPNGGMFYKEQQRSTRELNARLLRDIARRLAPTKVDGLLEMDDILSPEAWKQGDMKELSSSLEEELLSFDEMHRTVLTALGLEGAEHRLTVSHLIKAMDIIEESDAAKAEWADAERQLQKKVEDGEQISDSANESRLKRLRKTCNHHEKVLLRGVVNPESIRVTWEDVHAPSHTKEALQTLTTLSLTRPDAFKYGVLATDKISGALLYGPPGTGKTLLAKAVAKQSGATVLEVSGSDLYDMYVGEAEKNVRAVFSLAKKLSPCVVFIDEADAIFASRGSGTNRNSHRELINQFLREWDGMTETNAFIMLATNRPFDLDDAALRRLPRRILVDLPIEKDREAILGIHLKNEQLDSSVSLADLASKTPLFSGSDLKNLAVSAALAAVKEETEAAAAHVGDTAFQYAEKRTLEMRHFDRALEEISASVSDDMSSLGAIRKFDEKYGDKRGKKKRASYGFAVENDGKNDTNKVRT